MKEKLLVVGVVLALLISGVSLLGSGDGKDGRDGRDGVGAVSGPDHYEQQYFYSGLSSGAGCFSTTTTGILSAASLENFGCINIASTGVGGQGTISLTLPASTTMAAIVPRAGMCRDWFIDTTDVVAATTTTFVAGTGWNLVGLDATGAGTGADVIDGNEYGRLTACRETDGDIVGFLQEWIHAD